MTNPIGNGSRIDRAGIGATTGKTPTEQRSQSAGTSAPRHDTGDGTMSSQSERLQAVRAAIDSTPATDVNRVEDIRNQLARGEYPLDPDRIAERFAEFERLLHS